MSEVRRVEPELAHEVLHSLKHEGYNVLVDLTAVDYSAYPQAPKAGPTRFEGIYRITEPPGASQDAAPSGRFDVVYRLMSLDAETGLETKPRVEVHCAVETEPVLRSVRHLWPAADWLEREVWDMFGVGFIDRPDIKRLLMYEEFKGHPLRKDYPIARRQPLSGPPAGELEGAPSFNVEKPTIQYE